MNLVITKQEALRIRIENLVLVKIAEEIRNSEHKMLEFETLTLAPIDLSLVKVSELTKEEKKLDK